MAAPLSQAEKKGHICPPSDAKHPSDRWESLFVYSFICKFTSLRGKVEGLHSPMDLENALLGHEPNPIFTKVLAHFVLNLRPLTRNLSVDQISSTVASALSDHFKTSERTVFWDDYLKMNVDPFERMEGGIFAASWDLKLKILRVLVEMQLMQAPDIKNTIDRAWGVVHSKHKKKEPSTAPPEASDPKSQERLQQIPIGQDMHRKRYWVVDDSPRIYISTNPWKVTATFESISSTREEYLAIIERLKNVAPPPDKKGRKRLQKLEQSHQALIKALEDRLEAIDIELARVQRIRRRIEARQTLMAQAEVRETRTRRQTQRPDYVYHNVDSEDDGDMYVQPEDGDYDDRSEDDEFSKFRADERNGSGSRRGGSESLGWRRSARAAAMNANIKRAPSADPWVEWRGERRSARLGAPPEVALEGMPPPKRARTEESTVSTHSTDEPGPGPSTGTSMEPQRVGSGFKIRINGAAAVKPTETVVEQIAGKKKSKFWVYAVEPLAGTTPSAVGMNGPRAVAAEPNGNGSFKDQRQQSESSEIIDPVGSPSPASSMES